MKTPLRISAMSTCPECDGSGFLEAGGVRVVCGCLTASMDERVVTLDRVHEGLEAIQQQTAERLMEETTRHLALMTKLGNIEATIAVAALRADTHSKGIAGNAKQIGDQDDRLDELEARVGRMVAWNAGVVAAVVAMFLGIVWLAQHIPPSAVRALMADEPVRVPVRSAGFDAGSP